MRVAGLELYTETGKLQIGSGSFIFFGEPYDCVPKLVRSGGPTPVSYRKKRCQPMGYSQSTRGFVEGVFFQLLVRYD